jgi:hypothetical protein
MPPPGADPAFRERLKAEFTSGAIAARGSRAGLPSWRGFFSLPRLWVPVATAAAAALALAIGTMNQGPAWTIASAGGSGVARIDGAPVPVSARAELDRRIGSGARVEVPEGAELNLVAGKTLAVLATAGTELIVPPSPARWFGRDAQLHVRRGILRVSTGRDFHGARLTLRTPEAMAEVTGTTLAVICDPEVGTCVCVYEGVVRVGPSTGGNMVAVPGGMRRIVYADRRPPVVREILGDERVMLGRYREEMRPVLQ